MNSLRRILYTCRALVREMGPLTYFIGTLIFIGLFILTTFITDDSSQSSGKLLADYSRLSLAEMMTLMLSVGTITASIIGIDFIAQELKEEGRGIRFLSLPVSQGERFLSLALINFVYVPLIVYVPMFAVVGVISILSFPGFLLPSVDYLLPLLPYGFLIHACVSGLWLFLAIGFPRRVWLIFLAVLVSLGLYIGLTRDDAIRAVRVPADATAFTDPAVVGMSEYDVLFQQSAPTAYDFGLPEPFGVLGWFGILVFIGLLASAWLALYHKTT